MNISSSSSTYASSHAHRLLASLLQQAKGVGQNQPGGDSASAPGAAPAEGPPSGPPPTGGPSFASKTLASLLSAQEASPSTSAGAAPSGLVDRLIKSADTDGDGSLSADELKAALGDSAPDDLPAEISKLDTDGDGKLSADELTSALQSRPGRQAHHARASADDLAARLISDVDSDGDGSLSLDEVNSALPGKSGASSSTNLTDAFGKLDTDGDGKLSTAELSAALTAFRSAHARSAQSQAAASA